MVENERYCPEVMKQISALQASLERTNRTMLQNHLETCFSQAMAEGRSDEIISELMETMKYTGALTGPTKEADTNMTNEITFAVDGMTCGHCVGTVESTLREADAVRDAAVDLEKAQAKVRLARSTDPDADVQSLIEAVAEAGYTMTRVGLDE